MKRMFTLAVLFFFTRFQAEAQVLLDARKQPQFAMALPVPPVVDARLGGIFSLSATQFRQYLGLVDPATGTPLSTTVWGYEGSYPGPTILASRNIPVEIFWQNRLEDEGGGVLPHLFPIDTTLHWALADDDMSSGVPIVTHLHGGHSEHASDGLPEAWYTPAFRRKGPDFLKGDLLPFHYDNDQEAATLWYHDHALGITRLNVYAGLAGFYLLTDENEQGLKSRNELPADPYDLGIVIQDRLFTTNGELFYPTGELEEGQPENTVMPEAFGDFILVNGALWPYLEVEPRPYRFRMLNGSDSRFYNLYLSSGQNFFQVGTDDGLLPSPVARAQVLIGTGERRDVVVDFSGMEGQTIIMRNNAKTPYPHGRSVDPQTTGRIMAFRVTKSLDAAYPKSVLPSFLRPVIPALTTSLPARKLVLFEGEDEYGRLKPLLGTFENGTMRYMDPVTERPALNSTEIWEIYNQTMDAHTIHLHLVHMQLLNRQKFIGSTDEETGRPLNVKLIGSAQPPLADEAGWKDTYVMYPREVTRVIATFDRPGAYVWHCHILSHEDHEMMRPFLVSDQPDYIVKQRAKEFPPAPHRQFSVQPVGAGSWQLQVVLDRTAVVTVRVYNAAGALVKQAFNGRREAGRQSFLIDWSNWAAGTYFIDMSIDGERLTGKLFAGK